MPLIAVLTLFSVAEAAAEHAWRRVADDDFVVLASLPGEITTTHSTRDSVLGTARSSVYRATTEETRFAISITELPKRAAWLTPRGVLLRFARDNFLSSTNGVQRHYGKTRRGAIDGKILRFQEGERVGQAELFVIERRLVVAASSYPESGDDRDLQRFFSTLEISAAPCRGEQPPPRCQVDVVLAPNR